MNDVNDLDDRRLRQLAGAMVADHPEPPALDADRPRSYVDVRGNEAARSRRQVLVGAAAALALVVAGGVAVVQGGSLAQSGLDAASQPLVPTTTTPAVPPLAPDVPLLEDRYQLSRSSWDDPAQNLIVPIGADEVPANLIGREQVLASHADLPLCDASAFVVPCVPPYTAARLARYQGFGGYESAEDVLGPGASEVRHDVIVWVVVLDDADFALALSPEDHHPMVGALLIDATTGTLVGGGSLLPPS